MKRIMTVALAVVGLLASTPGIANAADVPGAADMAVNVIALAPPTLAGTSEQQPTTAASLPYRRWARGVENHCGTVFHPKGDWFEVWRNGWGNCALYWRYHGTKAWKHGAYVSDVDYKKIKNLNFDERRKIDFWITGEFGDEAGMAYFRTNGS